MLAQEQIERNEIAKAELHADADRGREYMCQMDAKHYEQGFMAAQIGLSADNAGLYSHAHLAGYAAAKRGATPRYVSVGGLPALARQYAGGRSGISPVKRHAAGGSGITPIKRHDAARSPLAYRCGRCGYEFAGGICPVCAER